MSAPVIYLIQADISRIARTVNADVASLPVEEPSILTRAA